MTKPANHHQNQQQQPEKVQHDSVHLTDMNKEAARHLINVSAACEPVIKMTSQGERLGSVDVFIRMVNLSDHFDYELGLLARNAW